MSSSNASYNSDVLPELLPIYYKRLFPYGPYYKWLSYGGVSKTYFTQREFSFTLKDDVYLRYQSFSDQQELEREIQKRCPYKIDIGAVFSHKPKEHKMVKAAAFQAQEKELVFDIDMTDYDDVRSCCSGADICPKCWPLMTIAIKIVDTALREDFGYEHLLWVYSGRRGVHCWVCDEGARKLSQSGRTAIAEYLSVVKGGESQIKKVTLPEKTTHPSIQRSIGIVSELFDDYALKKQDFLASEEDMQKVLALIPDEDLRNQLMKLVKKTQAETSRQRWMVIKKGVEDGQKKSQSMKTWKVVEEIMLQYCYPRLDVNVSKGVNHLLKSPFCVHPKTGRVCVPIDVENVENFDPFTVPTISEICEELDEKIETSDGDEGTKRRMKDYRQTSLKTYITAFDQFLKKLENSWKGKVLEQSDMKGDF